MSDLGATFADIVTDGSLLLAIAVAALYAQQQYGEQTQLLVLPADHLIHDQGAFAAAVSSA